MLFCSDIARLHIEKYFGLFITYGFMGALMFHTSVMWGDMKVHIRFTLDVPHSLQGLVHGTQFVLIAREVLCVNICP